MAHGPIHSPPPLSPPIRAHYLSAHAPDHSPHRHIAQAEIEAAPEAGTGDHGADRRGQEPEARGCLAALPEADEQVGTDLIGGPPQLRTGTGGGRYPEGTA